VSEAGGRAYVVVARRDTRSVARRSPKEAPAVACSGNRAPHCDDGTGTGAGEEGGALVARVWVEEECVVGKSGGESGVQLVVQWKRGHDS